MTWETELFALLDDLEGQAGALYAAERGAELLDRSRSAYAEVELAGRLMAAVDSEIGVDVCGIGLLSGRLQRVANGWFLLRSHDRDWVVRTAEVLAVHGASSRAVPEVAWAAVARLGLGSVLRRLGEAGEGCVLHRVDGARHEGVVRRVGADFVEVEVEAEIDAAAGRVVLVAFSGLAAVQSRV